LSRQAVASPICIRGWWTRPFLQEEKPKALRPDDIARAFIFAIEQPDHVLLPHLPVYPKQTQP